jgi:radical SAM-linked protein
VKLAGLTSPTGPSLTLAPEAGSQRMRDIINKNVTEADILGAVEEAARAGKTTLKLYFMIGLPWEEDADALAIADLCFKIREVARVQLGPRASRLQLNVSVNSFIPKPFTPFQWAGMADRATLARRQSLIRDRLPKPGVRLSFSRVDASYLEAALARGDEKLGDVIEEAWTLGARLDSWTEEFRDEAWREAFASVGTSAEELATATLDPDQPLPWDLITGVVDRDFLRTEWERAATGETTPDCRWDACSDCGVCVGPLANRLAEPSGTEASRQAAAAAAGATLGDAAPGVAPRWRYVATFNVAGRGRFLGHLDRVEIFRRAVRRAGGHLALSAGMRPKAQLSLALPLAVGAESLDELAEFELVEQADEGFTARLEASLPEHMRLVGLQPYGERKAVAARVIGASYEVEVRAPAGTDDPVGKLQAACRRFAESQHLPVEEKRERETRRVDVKEYVDTVRCEDGGDGIVRLSFRARVSPAGTARPERVVEALGALAQADLVLGRVVRTRIHLLEGGK